MLGVPAKDTVEVIGVEVQVEESADAVVVVGTLQTGPITKDEGRVVYDTIKVSVVGAVLLNDGGGRG